MDGDDEYKISIRLHDEESNDVRTMKIGFTSTLKTLFNEYAEERGLSLRAFRFSYEGRTLFLSSVGNKTPEQMGMNEGSVFVVTYTNGLSEEPTKSTSSPKGKHCTSKKKGSKNKNKRRIKTIISTKTEEQMKVDHSKALTILFREAEDTFKEIRQRLNSLTLERTQPKSRSSRQRSQVSHPLQDPTFNVTSESLGGKAGKTHYLVHIGDVNNLYKTTKPSSVHSRNPQPQSLSLDLHGLTKNEAESALNTNLPKWNETAHSSSYPFVILVEIVCGGGSQVLSEVVERWIRVNENVANAPKSVLCRREIL